MQIGYKDLKGTRAPNGRFLFGGLDSAGGTKAIKSVVRVRYSIQCHPLDSCPSVKYSQTENDTARSPKMPHEAM